MKYDKEKPTVNPAINKELIEFLEKNIAVFAKSGLQFKIELIDKDDKDAFKKLKKAGIEELPAIIIGRKKLWKIKDIKSTLIQYTQKTGEVVTERDPNMDVMEEQFRTVQDLHSGKNRDSISYDQGSTNRRMEEFMAKRKTRLMDDESGSQKGGRRNLLAIGDDDDEPGRNDDSDGEQESRPRRMRKPPADTDTREQFASAGGSQRRGRGQADHNNLEALASSDKSGVDPQGSDMFSRWVSGSLSETKV